MMLGSKVFFLSAVLVGAVSAQIPPDKELALGQHMADGIESQHSSVTDEEMIAFVERVLKNLSSGESLRLPLKLKLIDNSDLVAALPGGFLILGLGAIVRADSEAELAGLLAHAMGHVQAGKFQTRSPGVSVPLIFLGCLRSNGGMGMVPRANAPEFELFESQADLLGLGYLVNAGYDPLAMVTVFDRWAGKYPPDEEVRSKAAALSRAASSYILNTSEFDRIKSRLKPPRRVPSLLR